MERVRGRGLIIGTIDVPFPFVPAPMDGYTDGAMRSVCRRHGAALCFTEMIPAIALVHGARNATRRLPRDEDDHPVAVQISGHDPDLMSRAAGIAVEAGADVVDINAGCPSRRVTNGGSGAALLSNLGLLREIVQAVVEAARTGDVEVPVTLKVRSGPTADRIVVDDVAGIAIETGVAAVTLHPRTRAQMFRGRADWSLIAHMKQACGPVPVIGNGDVTTPEDGIRMLAQTGCDGVMVGRAAVGNPWIFRGLAHAWRHGGDPGRWEPSRKERIRAILDHYDLQVAEYGGNEEAAARAFRKHLARYVRGMPGAVQVRRCMPRILSRASLVTVLSQVFPELEAGTGIRDDIEGTVAG